MTVVVTIEFADSCQTSASKSVGYYRLSFTSESDSEVVGVIGDQYRCLYMLGSKVSLAAFGCSSSYVIS